MEEAIDIDILSNNNLINLTYVSDETIDVALVGTILTNIQNFSNDETNFELIFLSSLL